MGRASLDRGNATDALRLARQAQALKVPDDSYAPGEPRVWQFVLDAESAARRSGVSLANNAAANGAVQQAGGTAGQHDEASKIAQMLFSNNDSNGNPVKQVQAEEVYSEPIGKAAGGGNYGERLYYAGMEALQAGDQETARTRFRQAWGV